MRMRSAIKAMMIFGLIAAGLQPASAGPMAGNVFIARIAYAEVKLGNGGTGGAILAQLDGVEYDSRASLLPPPTDTSYFPYVGSPFGDVGGNGNSRFVGCIVVKTKTDYDGGCQDFSKPNDPTNPHHLYGVFAPATLNFDPGLLSGNIIFSVSSKIQGFQITANLNLSSSGDLAPLSLDQNDLTPLPPARPETFSTSVTRGVQRPAAVTLGTIRSDVLPNQSAGVTSTVRAGMVMSLNETGLADLIHLMCTADTTPPDTPQEVGLQNPTAVGPKELVPSTKTGLPLIWTPNHCYA